MSLRAAQALGTVKLGKFQRPLQNRSESGQGGDMAQTKIMVALQDQDHVEGLMRLACEMARGTSAEVIALHVVEVGLGLPLDAESDVLDRAGRKLLASGHEVALQKFLMEIPT